MHPTTTWVQTETFSSSAPQSAISISLPTREHVHNYCVYYMPAILLKYLGKINGVTVTRHVFVLSELFLCHFVELDY